MVMAGAPNQINVSERAFHRVKDFFAGTPRGAVKIKGDRMVEMYFIDGILPSLADGAEFYQAGFKEKYRKYFHRPPRAFPSDTARE